MKSLTLKPKPKKSETPPPPKKDKGGMGTSPVTNVAKRTIPSPAKETMHQVYLHDGTEVYLRFIQPGDQYLIKELFAASSKETIYYRYFGYIPDVTPEFLARFTCVNPEREITLVAETKIAGVRKIIGVANLVKDADRNQAEYALLIADAWQKQGLGGCLTDLAAQIALEQGIHMLYAHFMSMNRAMNSLLHKKGFQIQFDHSGAYYAKLELEGNTPH